MQISNAFSIPNSCSYFLSVTNWGLQKQLTNLLELQILLGAALWSWDLQLTLTYTEVENTWRKGTQTSCHFYILSMNCFLVIKKEKLLRTRFLCTNDLFLHLFMHPWLLELFLAWNSPLCTNSDWELHLESEILPFVFTAVWFYIYFSFSCVFNFQI